MEQLALVTHEPRGRGKRGETGGTALLMEGLEGRQENVSAFARDPAHCRLCLCPLNWNTKQSGVDERVLGMRKREEAGVRGGGTSCLSPATLNLHCWLGIDWGTSERDRHTVTGKMNCHLAFLNPQAASNWPL